MPGASGRPLWRLLQDQAGALRASFDPAAALCRRRGTNTRCSRPAQAREPPLCVTRVSGATHATPASRRPSAPWRWRLAADSRLGRRSSHLPVLAMHWPALAPRPRSRHPPRCRCPWRRPRAPAPACGGPATCWQWRRPAAACGLHRWASYPTARTAQRCPLKSAIRPWRRQCRRRNASPCLPCSWRTTATRTMTMSAMMTAAWTERWMTTMTMTTPLAPSLTRTSMATAT